MSNLRIAELDFDTIKQNLKTYLRGQDEFSDYDFEGSGLSVLLDILAYNTHYNAYLANMLMNEMFLDSAVKRASAVSIAKHLGYIPRSAVGSKAVVDVVVTGVSGNPTTLTLNRYTPFSTSIGGNAYTFLNVNEVSTVATNGTYNFSNLEIIEGTLLENNFVCYSPGPDEKFELSDVNVDTDTLLVTVQNSSSESTTTAFTLARDLTNVTSTSSVYYIEENPNGKYEIFFGDGVLGKKLSAGNIIKARYLSVSGAASNVSNNISTAFTTPSIGGSSNVSVTVVTKPRSGAAKENISSIRFNAPRVNAARNRAVTAADYEAIILSNFSEAESISVWGGEDNVPPIYGKVFISLKPFEGFTISQATKNNIAAEILQSKKVLAIQPEFIDPEYFYVNMITNVEYDSTITTKSSSQIQTIVSTAIRNYFSSDLQKFNKDFNKSKLVRLILDSDSSVVSVIVLLKLQKRLRLLLNQLNTFSGNDVIKLQNPIAPGTFFSSRFFVTSGNTTVLARMVDIPDTMPPSNTGTGTIQIRNVNTGAAINTNVGNVSYGSGEVVITGFTPTALPNNVNDFRVTASVQEAAQNIQVYRNQILVLDETARNQIAGIDAGLTINVTPIVQ